MVNKAKALFKIWCLHGDDYEECRLRGYKASVRTSQETYYVSTTELSQLMLFKIWCFHGGVYEECRLLGFKNPLPTSQETHYFSATESSQLMLCKIWCFHGGDYEQCRLLWFKNPVLTSQETHYVSATELNRLMLCKIRKWVWRMASSCLLRRVPLVRADVSEELSASFIRMTRISGLGTTAVTSNRRS
jgi:hypothetical protein